MYVNFVALKLHGVTRFFFWEDHCARTLTRECPLIKHLSLCSPDVAEKAIVSFSAPEAGFAAEVREDVGN